MIRRYPLLSMGILIFLAFVWQAAFALRLGTVRLDLLAVLVALGAYRWDVKGGVLAGIWSGLLASTLLSGSSLRVVFLYALFGFVAALLIDGAIWKGVARKMLLAISLSLAFFLFEAVLFSSQGLTRWPELSLGTVVVNAAVLFALVQSTSWLPLDGASRSDGALVRGIVA